MKLNTWFVVHAVVAIVFALGMIFMPAFLLSMFGGAAIVSVSPMFVQMFGATLVGTFVLLWLMRGVSDTSARRAVVIAYFVYFVIATAVSIMAQLSGVFNMMGWSTPGHLIILGLGYAYFLFVKKDYS
ncbi:MAG: hypothetical protein ISS57_12600 [Anaerolineales bacterium]|nr:hypothetical protein [Anaerolineales bacterium]